MKLDVNNQYIIKRLDTHCYFISASMGTKGDWIYDTWDPSSEYAYRFNSLEPAERIISSFREQKHVYEIEYEIVEVPPRSI